MACLLDPINRQPLGDISFKMCLLYVKIIYLIDCVGV